MIKVSISFLIIVTLIYLYFSRYYCRNYYPKTLTTRRRITDRLANSQFQSLYNSLSLYFSLYSLYISLSVLDHTSPSFFILLEDRSALPASPFRSLRPTPTHVRWAIFLCTHTHTLSLTPGDKLMRLRCVSPTLADPYITDVEITCLISAYQHGLSVTNIFALTNTYVHFNTTTIQP